MSPDPVKGERSTLFGGFKPMEPTSDKPRRSSEPSSIVILGGVFVGLLMSCVIAHAVARPDLFLFMFALPPALMVGVGGALGLVFTVRRRLVLWFSICYSIPLGLAWYLAAHYDVHALVTPFLLSLAFVVPFLVAMCIENGRGFQSRG